MLKKVGYDYNDLIFPDQKLIGPAPMLGAKAPTNCVSKNVQKNNPVRHLSFVPGEL